MIVFNNNNLMPPKKINISQNQQRLNFNSTSDSQLHRTNNKQTIDHQIAKLLKLRQQLDKKKLEEQRLMRKIMNLQIGDLSSVSKQSTTFIQDQQYFIITKMESLQGLEKISLLKLMVEDYGEIVIHKKQLLIEVEQQEQEMNKNSKQLQTMTEQWRQHGNLKEQYLVQYESNFINILNSYQYVANEVSNGKNNIDT